LPKEIIEVLEQTKKMNHDYEIYYFDDSDVENFMKEFGLREYICYNKLIPGAFKADLFRYCILYKFGGCYSDIGHVMYKSFDYICSDNNLVIVKDMNSKYWGIHNALICSNKSTDFIKKLIDKSCDNIENNYYGINSLDITGPTMMGNVYNCLFENYCNYNNKEIIKSGIVNINNLKIEILNFKNTNNDFFIRNSNDEIILLIKFKNYSKIMYHDRNVKHYGELWNKKKVYNKENNKNSLIVVVSKYKENTDWLQKLKYPYLVYTKNENDYSKYNIPKNKGNEASVYFKFIIDNYNNLPDYVAFIHAHESDWHHKNSMADKLNGITLKDHYINLNDNDFKNIISYKNDRLYLKIIYNQINENKNSIEMLELEMVTWYNDNLKEYFGPLVNNSLINIDLCCAQFIVSKFNILNLPFEFYIKQYNWLLSTELDNSRSGRFYEWMWSFIFNLK